MLMDIIGEDATRLDAISLATYIHPYEAGTPDGILERYQFVNNRFADIRWGILIADEAHIARNVSGTFNYTMRPLKWRNLVWITGTPLMSSLGDILSPLVLIWHNLGFG
ncbi:hypothetical protein GGI42DRAFT_355122 [Trichoderma sp. SZMC 28013]